MGLSLEALVAQLIHAERLAMLAMVSAKILAAVRGLDRAFEATFSSSCVERTPRRERGRSTPVGVAFAAPDVCQRAMTSSRIGSGQRITGSTPTES